MTNSSKGICIFNVQSNQVYKSLFILVLIFSINLRAQTQTTLTNRQALTSHYLFNDSSLQQKWSLYKYNYLSVGDENAYLSAPLAMQLNHSYNHLNTFTGGSATQTYYDFSTAFVNSDISKNQNAFFNNQGYGMYSKFETGMMHNNDKKTLTVMGTMIFGVMSSMYSDQQSRQSSSKQ